jgi:hypothetical protein
MEKIRCQRCWSCLKIRGAQAEIGLSASHPGAYVRGPGALGGCMSFWVCHYKRSECQLLCLGMNVTSELLVNVITSEL